MERVGDIFWGSCGSFELENLNENRFLKMSSTPTNPFYFNLACRRNHFISINVSVGVATKMEIEGEGYKFGQ